MGRRADRVADCDIGSDALRDLVREYLDRVDRGDMSQERANLHDRLLREFWKAGIPFRNRDDARDVARRLMDSGFACEWAILFWHQELAA